MKVKCPNCGSHVTADGTFVTCPYCGANIRIEDNSDCSFLGALFGYCVVPLLILYFIGEWLLNFSGGTYGAIAEMNADFIIWMIALHLGIFFLPVFWFFLAAYFLPLLLACATMPIFDNVLVTVVAVLIAGAATPSYIGNVTPYLGKVIFWIWKQIGKIFFHESEDEDGKCEKFAVWALILTLVVIPVILFVIAHLCGYGFFDVISALTA